MDRREIIALTFENMTSIYDDVGRICQIIEEKMKNHGFEAMGNKAVTWDTSTSLNYPEGWLHTYFSRVYLKKRHPKKAVGYCIHLFCGDYEEESINKINQLNLVLPMMNLSLLNLDKNVSDLSPNSRSSIYNCLWAAGWDCSQEEVKENVIVYSNVTYGTVLAKAETYFLDLLLLNSEEAIDELVIQPMKEMFVGIEEWLVKSGLPVLKIGIK